jgi:hypothetical protein
MFGFSIQMALWVVCLCKELIETKRLEATSPIRRPSCPFPGQVELIPLDSSFTTFSAIWSGEVVVEGGTGRFANAGPGKQPLKLIAINDPFTFADAEWTFSWTLDDIITLHRVLSARSRFARR